MISKVSPLKLHDGAALLGIPAPISCATSFVIMTAVSSGFYQFFMREGWCPIPVFIQMPRNVMDEEGSSFFFSARWIPSLADSSRIVGSPCRYSMLGPHCDEVIQVMVQVTYSFPLLTPFQCISHFIQDFRCRPEAKR